MKIPYVTLGTKDPELKTELLNEVEELLDTGMFILGKKTEDFEQNFAQLCQSKHAIGVSNGTISLMLCMQAAGIGKGDEVITAPNSYLASASSIALVGATPVFADVDSTMNISPESIRSKITPNTKAIIPVHLTGRPADMDSINAMAKEHGLLVIEDAAQAVGASYKGCAVGSLGDFASFSLHPLKNLGACGDAGIITTDNDDHAAWLRKARTHGMKNRDECEFWSYNARIDAMQAALLNIKMKHLKKWNDRRRHIADQYNEILRNDVLTPEHDDNYHSVYHAYIIQTPQRDDLMAYLHDKGIDAKIHYPIAIHQQAAAQSLGYTNEDLPVTSKMVKEILSLPVHHQLTDKELAYICGTLRSYFN